MENILKSKEFLTRLAVFLAALFIFSAGIRSIGYSSPDEKRYVQSAEEMIKDGDWITPHYHGRPRFQKPILFYWLAASGISIFKERWFGARFPSAVCGAITVLITYLLGKSLYDRGTGLFSASLLAVSCLFFIYSRLSTPDIAMVLFVTLSVYLFMKSSSIFFIALALGVLTKGLVGLLLPLVIITAYIFIFKQKRISIKNINIPLGAVIFFVIVLPWFAMMAKIHGSAYTDHIWQVETVGRIKDLWSGNTNILYNTAKSFIRYLLMTLLVFLPSALFLPIAAIDVLRRRGVDKRGLFMISWIFTVIIFFSVVGTKKVHYLLPLAPALSVFIGSCLAAFAVRKGRLRAFQVFIAISVSIYLILFAYIIPGAGREGGLFALSENILSVRKDGEAVGVGSHFVSHNRLDSYLGINVKKVNVDLRDPLQQVLASRKIITQFLKNKERVFCLITKEDYDNYVSNELKESVFILDKKWYWKKPNQLRLNGNAILAILKGSRDAINRYLKNEIYLISNKKE